VVEVENAPHDRVDPIDAADAARGTAGHSRQSVPRACARRDAAQNVGRRIGRERRCRFVHGIRPLVDRALQRHHAGRRRRGERDGELVPGLPARGGFGDDVAVVEHLRDRDRTRDVHGA
jgi:hypothetical protein